MENDLNFAIGQVLFQMNQINHTLAHNYVHMNDWELHIQEGYMRDWARKMVAASDNPETNALYLRMYEDSLEEFQAKRMCVNLSENGDEPSGFKVWRRAKGGEVLAGDLSERPSTELLTSLSQLDDIFNSDLLSDAAKRLRLSVTDAADLKVALPLIKDSESAPAEFNPNVH